MENARLSLDAAKAKAKSGAGHRGMNPDVDSMVVSEEARADIEKKEDELVAQTEEAEGVMKNVSTTNRIIVTSHVLTCIVQVLDTPEPLRNLAELIAAQLEFHKRAYEILAELAPVVDGLQEEQEVSSTAAVAGGSSQWR